MIPPGLSFIAISQKAWEASEKSNLPKFYLNLKSYSKSLLSNSNPYTPAINLVFALDEALKMMREEGLENIFFRHKKHKLAMSNAMKAHLKGKIFRVGHLGYVNDRDIITVISAISETLLNMGKINSQQAGKAMLVASKYLDAS